ncbi:MAG: hypothetical protein QXP91_05950 [Candidatus Methanomethylicia archaeon]
MVGNTALFMFKDDRENLKEHKSIYVQDRFLRLIDNLNIAEYGSEGIVFISEYYKEYCKNHAVSMEYYPHISILLRVYSDYSRGL